MKELFVNKEACIGCGACVAIDPEHFDFDEDGLSTVIANENIDTEDAQNAISSCPTNAISYIESEPTAKEASKCSNPNCHCDNCTCENCTCDGDGCHCDCCNDDCECDSCNCDNCDCSKKESTNTKVDK